MPKRNIIQIHLPPIKPDCCVECPLLGIIPKDYERPKNSKETRVCIGTMEALTERGSKVRASEKDNRHPWHRPCDTKWDAWMHLPKQTLGVNIATYNTFRIPFEQSLQLRIKFHR